MGVSIFRNFRGIVSYLLASRYCESLYPGGYGSRMSSFLLRLLNTVLDERALMDRKMRCSSPLHEAALGRALQVLHEFCDKIVKAKIDPIFSNKHIST